MGSKELIANLFRISQTEEKLRKDVADNAKTATSVHYSLGRSLLPMEIREGRLLFTPFGCSSNSIQPILSRLRRGAGCTQPLFYWPDALQQGARHREQ